MMAPSSHRKAVQRAFGGIPRGVRRGAWEETRGLGGVEGLIVQLWSPLESAEEGNNLLRIPISGTESLAEYSSSVRLAVMKEIHGCEMEGGDVSAMQEVRRGKQGPRDT